MPAEPMIATIGLTHYLTLAAVIFCLGLLTMMTKRNAIGILIGVGLVFGGHQANEYASTDEFCESCHVHPHATNSWRRSTHYDTDSGMVSRIVLSTPAVHILSSSPSRTGGASVLRIRVNMMTPFTAGKFQLHGEIVA